MIDKVVTRVIQYFCFPERPMKGGDILVFCSGPTQLFWSEIFRSSLKLEGLLPWFARLKCQFIDRNDKLKAILKSYLLEYNKHLQTLRLGHDEISNKIK